MKIEDTKWAKDFKSDCPGQYDAAIRLVSKPDLKVDIDYNNENGEWVHAIRVVGNYDFWLDAKKTLEQSEKLCAEMNWEIVR